MDRPTFLVALDDFARAVSAQAPASKVGMCASATNGDWCVFFNGPPLFLGHTAEDLEAAARDFAAAESLGAVLESGPHVYTGGALAVRQALLVAGGPVAEA